MKNRTLKKTRQEKKKRSDFFEHLYSYLLICSLFGLINIVASGQHLWFIYPTLVWGASLLFHYHAVFGIPFLKKDKIYNTPSSYNNIAA